ncbi:MAG: MutS-related protein, partial [Thermomicrobiales bacterium]
LSVLAHDHPTWTYPTVSPAEDRFAATGMAHPLIVANEAVANPVEVGPLGTLLFVTGSNMSGKSTLLRAVGVNAVLAQAGGPVCAAELRQPIVDIWTCMRVEDSLARGVSFFMAELQRLKAVVDAAKLATDRPVLYLLDEILQGTNTAERQIASRQVLQQLSRLQAIGAVSSHDLGLLEGDRLVEIAKCVHFAESFHRGPDGPDMTFDYTLRPGLATSTNALKLMELIGFELNP